MLLLLPPRLGLLLLPRLRLPRWRLLVVLLLRRLLLLLLLLLLLSGMIPSFSWSISVLSRSSSTTLDSLPISSCSLSISFRCAS